MPKTQPTEDTLKQLAEILETKGSLSIGMDNYPQRNYKYFYEQCRIHGLKYELQPFRRWFGGSLSTNGPRCKYIWRVTSNQALKLFETLRPFATARGDLLNALIAFGKARQAVIEAGGSADEANWKRFQETAQQIREEVRDWNRKKFRTKKMLNEFDRKSA